MDTKSKNTKYPLPVKALCLILSLLCFLGTAACGLYAALAVSTLQTDAANPLRASAKNFYDTSLFRSLVTQDFSAICTRLEYPAQKQALDDTKAQRDALVDAQVQRFLREKAAIIRGEVYFVATHYDDETEDGYYYEAYMRDFSTTTTAAPEEEDVSELPETTAAPETTRADGKTPLPTAVTESPTNAAPADDTLAALPKVEVNERAPYNVRYCQMLVNTVTGLDWLQYASLVRSDAFREQEFCPAFDSLHSDITTFAYDLNEQQARAEIASQFDRVLQERTDELETALHSAESRLAESVNMKFYASNKDGEVFTNMTDSERDAQNAASRRSIHCEKGSVTVRFPEGESTTEIRDAAQIFMRDMFNNHLSLTVFFSDLILPGDRYAEAYTQYQYVTRFSPKTVLLVGVLCAVGTLLFLITLLCLCGHKSGADGITTAFIDRLPTDLHLMLSAAAGILCVLGLIFAGENLIDWHLSAFTKYEAWIVLFLVLPLALGGLYLTGVEWLTSTVRIKKAGQSFFKKFVLWRIIPLLWKCVRFVFRKIRQVVLFFLEKPKKIRYIFLLSTVLYAGASVLWFMIAAAGLRTPGLAVVGVLILTVLYAVFQIRYLRTLDTIIDVSCDRSQLPIPHTETMPPALRTLADNLSVTSSELDKAVAQAVRDARTKAELITNVSHDLKTPLTAVISYVDLLKECDITDETARGYIDILAEKSENLKRLIEDLIEASKVSTGNVTLHCVALNFAELSMQAVVEATPELEGRGLEVKFTPPDEAPIIFADGVKTHRILENLLSNARKYAADDSRVYVRVYAEDGFGVFEIKNVSREALDIDPQELMERFVRGDKSRSQDGNGLGLSIAQQLCLLQGGRLEIRIDGDLFKASVFLPLQSAPAPVVEAQ